ncbi:hypothetical protein ebA3235 [Aromatoleum aromaticum EbN1]|uniref:Uncharacterized protein n=1 Tax=Aromatoleum aromaticum (strain DSM 19018 / LMG 30748 / EbN1) TaxID=76114 RepID=Q5P416_AROAE|nr:hypothetical protein ebA3235 [Aromatoleum aromaticum EbN1]
MHWPNVMRSCALRHGNVIEDDASRRSCAVSNEQVNISLMSRNSFMANEQSVTLARTSRVCWRESPGSAVGRGQSCHRQLGRPPRAGSCGQVRGR